MMENMPLVSIIILNYNGASFLAECIESVLATAYQPQEIIVVDNDSTDNSCDLLKAYPTVIVHRNPQNYGYAQGNNIGVARSSGKYLVILNNDVTVEPSWLNVPIQKMEEEPDIGLVCCRQMKYHQRDTIDGLYHVIEPDLTFFPFGQNRKLSADPRFLQSGYVIGTNGASAIIRRETFLNLDGFDPRFFAYQEETDLNVRAFLHGWRCYYAANSVVYHMGSMSFKKNKPMVYYFRERNRIWLLYKNYPFSFIIKYLPLLIILELRVVRVFFFKLGRPDLYLKARRDAFRELHHYKALRKNNIKLFLQKRNDFLYFKKHLFIA